MRAGKLSSGWLNTDEGRVICSVLLSVEGRRDIPPWRAAEI
jgi:hypothetical protein